MTVTLLIKPLGDRVVIKPKPKDEITSSVIREGDLLAIVTNGKK